MSNSGFELLKVETENLTILAVYKPPPTPFVWPQVDNKSNKPIIAIGDFNSHNTLWGYSENNPDGKSVEDWASSNGFALVHSAKDKPSFASARWKKGYNPDLTFVSSKHHQNFERIVGDPIPKSQHRPNVLRVKPVIQPLETKPMPRFNYRKAKWDKFTADLEAQMQRNPPKGYKDFQKLVWESAVQNIPRGCRKSYIPCLDEQSKKLYKEYTEAYDCDPFAEDTIQLGEDLLSAISKGRLDRWIELICNTDMTHNSKKAWSTLKKINTEKNGQTRVAAVTPNQVANQLLRNGKPQNK